MDHPTLTQNRVENARCRLVAKLDALERKATESSKAAMENIRDTAECVRSSVGGTAQDVRDAVFGVSEGAQHALDLAQHVRDRPWEFIGMAVAAGVAAGFLAHEQNDQHGKENASGILSELISAIRREVVGVGEAAIAAGMSAIKSNLTCESPAAERNGRHFANSSYAS